MLIVGAKGFAKEVLEIILHEHNTNEIVFYDDISKDLPEKLYDKYRILRTPEEAENYFQHIDNRFTLGIGNPKIRQFLFAKFNKIGGCFSSITSITSVIGKHETKIGDGTIITSGCVLTNSIIIGQGGLINLNSTIGHDSMLGDFVEICTGVKISGNVKIGDLSFIGSGAIILPGVSVGKNCIVGAGSVVTKDVQDNTTVVGAPARNIKK